MERELIAVIRLPMFIKKVELSKKRRATYFKKGSKVKIPKKYENYSYNKKGILVHPDGTPVVANPKSIGTPRVKTINGQEIYSGMPHHMRSKIVREIKNFFISNLKDTGPIKTFPIQLEMEMYDEIGVGNWDLDNLWIYNKCFQDALTEKGIIPEDNIRYITKAAAPEFFPVASSEDRHFIFKIYKDDRDEIVKNPYWQEIADMDW